MCLNVTTFNIDRFLLTWHCGYPCNFFLQKSRGIVVIVLLTIVTLFGLRYSQMSHSIFPLCIRLDVLPICKEFLGTGWHKIFPWCTMAHTNFLTTATCVHVPCVRQVTSMTSCLCRTSYLHLTEKSGLSPLSGDRVAVPVFG